MDQSHHTGSNKLLKGKLPPGAVCIPSYRVLPGQHFTVARDRNAYLGLFTVLVAGVSKLLHLFLKLSGFGVDVFNPLYDFLPFFMDFVVLPWNKEKVGSVGFDSCQQHAINPRMF